MTTSNSMPSAAWTQHPDQLDESRLSVSREEMRSRIEGCTGKKSRERKKGGAAPSRPCGARERSFWSTEGTDYLDERLGRLSETVEVPHSSSVSDSSFLRRAFVEATSNDEVNYCPYCLQPISSEYKHELIKRIEGVLNDRANEHQSILTGIQFPSFDGIVKRVEAFENSNREIYNLIRDLADACQKKVSEYLSYIDQKIKNLYTPVKIASLDLAVKTAQLNEQLLKLEKIRRDILAAQNEKQKTFEKLLRISENIAYWEIIDDYQDYKQQDCENKGLEKK